MRMKTYTNKLVGIIVLLTMLSACKSVPLTGRNQLSLVSESEMVSMSLTSYKAFLSENKLSTNKEQTEMVVRVGTNIAKAVEEYLKQNGKQDDLQSLDWEFNLIESDEPNAWCMAGGKVVVYTGLLPFTKNEDGLAVVIGHEIAHAVARHGSERMSQRLLMQMGGQALMKGTSTQSEMMQTILNSAYGITSEYGVLLPFSRKHEYEADEMGLMFMAMAGYNPKETVEFWTRMSSNKAQAPEFTSTHPLDQNRINKLNELMPEAMKYYKKY